MLAVLFFGKYVKIMLVMTNRAKNYERNNSQHCWTRLAVVTSALAVLCKQIQQLPTMLGPAVHRGKDTSPKTLKIMCNARAWPQQCWRSCAINGSNIVALRLGDHGTKEMLRVVGSEVGPVSNFAQQHATTCNRVCKRTQHVTSNNFESCWSTTLRPFGSARCSMRL